jgi:hypothetical protein
MPLKIGGSDKIVSRNIAELVKGGMPKRQAIAAAMRKAGRAKSEKK